MAKAKCNSWSSRLCLPWCLSRNISYVSSV